MSVLMEQHDRWTEARSRLWNGPEPAPRARRPRPVSPFVRAATEAREEQFRREQKRFERQVMEPRKAGPLWFEIVFEVATKHGVGIRDVLGTGRTRNVVLARHESFWRMRRDIKVLGLPISYPQIGRRFGGMDHTTVLHGIRMHEQRMREAEHG
jgi:chromosomal replication initiation ATPase DnaA